MKTLKYTGDYDRIVPGLGQFSPGDEVLVEDGAAAGIIEGTGIFEEKAEDRELEAGPEEPDPAPGVETEEGIAGADTGEGGGL